MAILPRWLSLGALGSVLLASPPSNAATMARGSIGDAQTWEASGNPYLVDADLTVETGASLTLAAGVDVRFANQDAHDMGTDAARVELIVKGELRAVGTLSAPVLLHAQDDEFANSWHGIVVDAEAKAVSLAHVELFSAGDAVSSAALGQVLELKSSSIHHNFTGISLTAGASSLEQLLVFDNSIAGVYAQASESDVTFSLTNSVVRLNGSYGAFLSASHAHRASASIEASTLYGNISAGVTCKASGAGAKSTLSVHASIIASNGIAGVDASGLDGGVADVSATYSDVFSNGVEFSGSTPGQGCISADPLFVDAPLELELRSDSPCIDSASDARAPAADLLGQARPQGAGYDMGAYEYAASVGGDAGTHEDAGGVAGLDAVTLPPVRPSSADGDGCGCSVVGRSRPEFTALSVLVIAYIALGRRRA